MKSKNENIKVNPSKTKGAKKTKILFEKELTIYSVEDFLQEIKNAFKKYEEIELVISNVDNLDLTFVQLMQSLKISAIENKKTLIFKADIQGEQKMLLENSGFSEFFKN